VPRNIVELQSRSPSPATADTVAVLTATEHRLAELWVARDRRHVVASDETV
jgi:hypothetical protein